MRPFSTPLGRWLGLAALAVGLASPALAQRTVTLRMNSATMPDTVKASAAAGVQVRGQVTTNNSGSTSPTQLPGGNVIDWNGTTTIKPANNGGDYWTVDFQIPENEKLEFKFYIDQSEGENLPGGWEDGGNHVIEAGTGDVVRDLHYFNKTGGDQAYDWRPFATGGADSVAVWFRVYLNTEDAATKGLDLQDSGLAVAVRGDNATKGSQRPGTTIDWGSSNVVLKRESSDAARPGFSLFSGRVAYPRASVGTTQAYKFYFKDSDTADGWEAGDNRTFKIPAQDSTLHWKFFGDSPALKGALVTSNVTFNVDISPLTQLGLFQTSDDFVQVRGAFNGWDCPDANSDDCLLQQAPGTAEYLRQIPIRSVVGTADSPYKYYISLNNPDGTPFFTNPDGTENFDAGYEEPLDYGGGNRPFTFTGSDQTLETAFFNSIRPGNLIADGRTINVTFTVDMNDATTFADSQGRAFDPAKDSMTVQFEDSFWLLTQGRRPGSQNLLQGAGGSLIPGFKLTDPDGDLVYTGTLAIEGPTYNAIAYRYAFASAGGDLVVEGAGGFDAGRRRYRYVTDLNANAFSFALDTFRPKGPSGAVRLINMPWEVNPTGTLKPGDVPYSVANGYVDQGNAVSVPTGPVSDEFALGNVYPNPTAGTASVVVSGRADARVTVRVYDLTGRVVATVADDVVIDGRPLQIDTSGLSAGLYLVRADSGTGVATARLTVVR